MPLFARRDIQERIFALGNHLTGDQVEEIVARLNDHKRDRLAALWEVVVLHAFSTLGALTSEAELEDGKRPDILLQPHDPALPTICADITAVSDAGIEAENPVQDLLREIFKAARKIGLSRGLHIRVEEERVPVRGGAKVKLLLPPRRDWDSLIAEQVTPFLRRAKQEVPDLPPLVIDTGKAHLSIAYGGASHSAHFASYRKTTSVLANPLMNQLKKKARKQLRKVPPGYLKGVVACDAFADSLRGRASDHKSYSRYDVANVFMAENTSIDFVFFVSVETRHPVFCPAGEHRIDSQLVVRPSLESHLAVALMAQLPRVMPQPLRSLSIASGMAKQKGLGTRGYGALSMSKDKIKIPVRLLLDVLAGRTSFAKLATTYPSSRPNPFDHPSLLERLMSSVDVVRGGPGDDDDYVEFTFGPRDAVNGPYLAQRPSEPD